MVNLIRQKIISYDNENAPKNVNTVATDVYFKFNHELLKSSVY